MYWVRGSETVIRCFSPCDNALEVEEPRRRSPQSFRNLLVELSSPNRAPTQRGVGLRFALDADESNNHIIGVGSLAEVVTLAHWGFIEPLCRHRLHQHNLRRIMEAVVAQNT